VGFTFEWNDRKARINQHKHGVTFTEACTVFGDPLALTIGDPDHSPDEERSVTLGYSARGRLLAVVHMERGAGIRIITARIATLRERTVHEEDNCQAKGSRDAARV
jgi:hypothetical protein